MSDYLSKRVKKKVGSGISSTRYDYLSLDQAEPDLGNPLVGPSSVGAKPFPNGSAYILASFASSDPKGDRYWVPPSSLTGLGLGVVPGAFTIRDEGALVGTANSFTTLNFAGDNVSVDYVGPLAEEQTGIATVRLITKGAGSVNSIQYHGTSGVAAGATGFFYEPFSGNVGIGSTLPSVELDIDGSIKVTGVSTISSLYSDSLTTDTILVNTLTSTNSLSIGSTEVISSTRQLKNIASLDATTKETIENAVYNAPNDFSDLNVIGIATFQDLIIANGGLQIGGGSSLSSLEVAGIATFGYLNADGVNVSGTTTTSSIEATTGDIDTLTVGFITSTNAHVAGVITAASIATVDYVSSGITTTNVFKSKYANVSTALTAANFYATNATVTGLSSLTTLYAGNASVGSTLTVANIGINTDPQYSLHVEGEVKISDRLHVSNGSGISGQVLLSQGGSLPPVWGAPSNITIGAAQSVYLTASNDNLVFLLPFVPEDSVGDIGSFSVDTDGLFYNPSTNNLGIGSTVPQFNLDVLGDINFTGTLYQNGVLGVFSRWTIEDSTQNIFRFQGNVGIGTSVLNHKFAVLGDTLLEGDTTIRGSITDGLTVVGLATINNFTSASSEIDILNVGAAGTAFSNTADAEVGIGTTQPRSKFEVSGETRIDGLTHFEGSITEQISSTFGTNIPSTSGVMPIDVSSGTVVVGVLTESVNTWAFTGVNTETAKATTITLIINSNSLLGYGETCTVNGGSPFGVRWGGGIAPLPTNNEDILSFTIATDSSGSVRVYGASALNFS